MSLETTPAGVPQALHSPASTTDRDLGRRGLFVVACAHATSDLYSGFVPLIVFSVSTHNGLSPVFQGIVGFIWYATSSIVQPAFGAYTDRHGRWWFLPAAVCLTTVGISLAGLATSPAALIALVVVGGLGSALMHPEGGRYSAMLSGARKATGMSIFAIGGQIGYALGPLLVAVALRYFGSGGTAWLMIPGLISAGLLFAAMRIVGPHAERTHRTLPTADAIAADRFGIALMVSSTALRQLVYSSFVLFLPNLLVGRGMTLLGAGQAVTFFLLVGVIGTLVGGQLADRFGALFVSIATMVATVPFLLAFFVLNGTAGLLSLAIGSILLSASTGPSVALVQSMLPRNLGMALGLMNGVAFGAGSALVTGVGAIVAAAGPALALAYVSGVPVLSAIAFGVVAQRFARSGIRAQARSS
jgi:FSR family fosmidomycin resistance protein-like MFS transporter